MGGAIVVYPSKAIVIGGFGFTGLLDLLRGFYSSLQVFRVRARFGFLVIYAIFLEVSVESVRVGLVCGFRGVYGATKRVFRDGFGRRGAKVQKFVLRVSSLFGFFVNFWGLLLYSFCVWG